MKATSPGHVIGKALTAYSGEGQGKITVFIQNTYYDGINDGEYTSFLASNSGSIGGAHSFPLDRFSFMVRKSLAKIDPKLVSGSGIGFDTIFQSFSEKLL